MLKFIANSLYIVNGNPEIRYLVIKRPLHCGFSSTKTLMHLQNNLIEVY